MSEAAFLKSPRRKSVALSYGELKVPVPGEISPLIVASHKLKVPPQYVWRLYQNPKFTHWPIPEEFRGMSFEFIGGVPYSLDRFNSFFNQPRLLTGKRVSYLDTKMPKVPVVVEVPYDGLPFDHRLLLQDASVGHAG